MFLSFAIIGPKKSPNTLDLCDVIDNMDYTSTIYNINDVLLSSDKAFKNSFLTHDIYLFRGYNKSINYAHILSSLLADNHKVVIDNLLVNSVVRNKLEEAMRLSSHNIPHPQTLYTQSTKKWPGLVTSLKCPIITKPLSGQQGQDIYKLNSPLIAKDFFNKNPKGFLAQQYIETDGDVRIFIVGTKILGAIKRFVIENDFRSNASLGAKTEPYNLTKKESSLALKAHKCIGYDISGIDMIFDKNNNPYILEVNHTPQWQVFKKTLSINPAEEIIKYSIKKYEEENRVL